MLKPLNGWLRRKNFDERAHRAIRLLRDVGDERLFDVRIVEFCNALVWRDRDVDGVATKKECSARVYSR